MQFCYFNFVSVVLICLTFNVNSDSRRNYFIELPIFCTCGAAVAVSVLVCTVEGKFALTNLLLMFAMFY